MKSARSNPYTLQLINALRKQNQSGDVTCSVDAFFRRDMRFDAVHIQWPESLFRWIDPSPKHLARVRRHLRRHRRRARIVTTVHNYAPHSDLRLGEEIFETVYSLTDDFIHLGRSSLDAFVELNRDRPWMAGAVHHVISHGDYSYYRDLPRDETLARIVREGHSGPVVLVFGALRTAEEEHLARTAFLEAGIEGGRLVFAGVVSESVKIDAEPHSDIQRLHGRVSPNRIAPLFEAADFIFVSRRGRLNSGVVSLALTFGVPVIGPDEGVIREQLAECGGFLYEAGNASSAATALRSAAGASAAEREARKKKMAAFVHDNMQWPDLARRHMDIYARPMAKKAFGWALPPFLRWLRA